MVDLVKIRKKKAKAKAEEAAAAQNAVAPSQDATESAQDATAQPATTNEPSQAPGNEQSPNTQPPPQAATADADQQPATPAVDKLAKFKQEAGRRREEQATDDTAFETNAAQLELLTFVISGEQYAVDIERIVEIVTPRAATRIPNADPSVVGIISLRGTIVTLVDVRRRLHHPPAGEANVETRVVVVDYHNETVGFVVDRVLRVVKAAAGEVEPPPVVHASELDESVRGVFRAGGALTILLDLDKLLDSRALRATVA